MVDSIIGVSTAIAYLRNIELNLDDIQKGFLLEIAENIVAEAKDLAPVKTGYMKANIRTETEGEDVIAGSFAEYSGFVDGGTSKMPARPFMSSAVLKHSRDIQGIWVRRAGLG